MWFLFGTFFAKPVQTSSCFPSWSKGRVKEWKRLQETLEDEQRGECGQRNAAVGMAGNTHLLAASAIILISEIRASIPCGANYIFRMVVLLGTWGVITQSFDHSSDRDGAQMRSLGSCGLEKTAQGLNSRGLESRLLSPVRQMAHSSHINLFFHLFNALISEGQTGDVCEASRMRNNERPRKTP